MAVQAPRNRRLRCSIKSADLNTDPGTGMCVQIKLCTTRRQPHLVGPGGRDVTDDGAALEDGDIAVDKDRDDAKGLSSGEKGRDRELRSTTDSCGARLSW